MKLIVSNAATLSLPDGSNFKIEPGIHDAKDFPDAVKKHWAFNSYVKPIDESEVEQSQGDSALSAHIVQLKGEVASLTDTVTMRDMTIEELKGEVASLTAQLVAKVDAKNDESATKDGKKQQTSK